MALFTPRGLKLRLPTAYAFALMARVYPKADAFRVLQLTEEIDNLPSLAGFLAAMIAFILRLEPLQIALVVFGGVGVFHLVHLTGFFNPPFTFLLPLSRIYSVISGYGVLLVSLLCFGFLISGYRGALAFVMGRFASDFVFGFVDMFYERLVFNRTGMAFTTSERSFFHAYRLTADKLGLSTSLSVDDAELAPASWAPVYADLGMKWPVVASRFTQDDV